MVESYDVYRQVGVANGTNYGGIISRPTVTKMKKSPG